MLLTLLAVTLVCAVTWLCLKWLKVRSYWKDRNVPYDPPHPIYGSLTHLLKQNMSLWMIDLYKKFKTPYVGIWWFWRPALVVNSPEIAKRILIKDADVFRNRLFGSGKSDPIGSLNIFTADDPLWTSVRRHLTPLFTTAKLKSVQSVYSVKSKELVQRIQRENDKNERFDIRLPFRDFSTDIVGTFAFGIKCDATLTGSKDPMRRVTSSFQEFSYLRGIGFISIMFFPELVDIFRFTFFPKSATDYLTKIFQAVVKERGGYEKPVTEVRDMIDALIKMKQDAAKEDEYIPEELLLAQATAFVQGGFETTATAMSLATYELAHNPDTQEKLYREILDIKESLGGEDFTTDNLVKATYLNCVINETLRKYTPMGWLDRRALTDYKIDDNLTIPAGMPVYVNMGGMQRDPQYYSDPDQFKPERFLPEAKGNNQLTYAPFGEGPRNCIGKRFALNTVRFGLAALILNYVVKPAANTPPPNEIEFDKCAPFLIVEDLYVDFVPRHR